MIFVIDLDDTICDTDGYSERYIKAYFKKFNLPYKQISKTARYAEMKFDWSQEEAIKWYKTYGDEMFLHFPVKNDAVKIINNLYDKGHKIIIATARNHDWHSHPVKYTNEWIHKVGLKYHKVFIGIKDKATLCKQENADVFIDDDLGLVEEVKNEHINSSKSIKIFLSETDYNKDKEVPEGIIKIKSLQDVIKTLFLDKEFEK